LAGLVGVRTTLLKIFRVVSDSLEKQPTVLVNIVIDDDDMRFGLSIFLTWKQILHRQSKGSYDVFSRTAGVALD
jgi:hypothetical protein